MTDFEPTYEGPDLLWQQVSDHLADRIERGELTPGRRLPPERQMAEDLGVAYMTVRRAMRDLRERGLIRSVQGRGTCVVGPPTKS